MRLTCPNCGAQYQVADGAIPATGRDVQCSNCNHVWFEMPGAAPEPAPNDIPDRPAPAAVPPAPEPAPPAVPPAPPAGYDDDGLEDPLAGVRRTVEQSTQVPPQADHTAPPSSPAQDAPGADTAQTEPPAPAPAPEPEPPAPPAPEPIAAAEPDPQPEPEPATDPSHVAPVAAAAAGAMAVAGAAAGAARSGSEPERPRMTPEIRDILKEEAARETQARRAERPAPEPDIDVAPPRTAAETEARETRFPDIDQINSSLRGQDSDTAKPETPGAAPKDSAAQTPTEPRKSGRGFWRGFWVVFLIVLLAVLAYLLAPTLAEAVPALKGPLMAYVTWVDQIRLAVTGIIQQ